MEINTINLSAAGTQELLRRLEWSDGVSDTYKMIVAELRKRGIAAQVPAQD